MLFQQITCGLGSFAPLAHLSAAASAGNVSASFVQVRQEKLLPGEVCACAVTSVMSDSF